MVTMMKEPQTVISDKFCAFNILAIVPSTMLRTSRVTNTPSEEVLFELLPTLGYSILKIRHNQNLV